jgi:hypothetical protein
MNAAKYFVVRWRRSEWCDSSGWRKTDFGGMHGDSESSRRLQSWSGGNHERWEFESEKGDSYSWVKME